MQSIMVGNTQLWSPLARGSYSSSLLYGIDEKQRDKQTDRQKDKEGELVQGRTRATTVFKAAHFLSGQLLLPSPQSQRFNNLMKELYWLGPSVKLYEPIGKHFTAKQ